MKVKHIITTCGAVLGGLIVTQGASAVVRYTTSTEVQFTFNPSLSVTVSDDFAISELAPGNKGVSDAVNVTVDTNNVTGYELKASVGNSTDYTSTALVNGSHADTFAMLADSASAGLQSGYWGYTLDSAATADSTSYTGLPLYSGDAKTINKTTYKTTTPATGYAGGAITTMKIGAYAKDNQRPGEYNNVINFTVVSNVVTNTLKLWADSGVSTVAINNSTSTTSGSYSEGDSINISAACLDGYSFDGWTKSATPNGANSGAIADASLANTTYTMGNTPITLTATCTDE